MPRSLVALLFAAPLFAAPPAGFHEVKLGKHTFTLPTGFTIELVAESPQVDRPVTAAFDDRGRLFVADSSGDNSRPSEQVKKPTHRVVMLESTKKDGRFDKSTVFADKLSFLQGTMWHDGSLYVATPPTIQKLTDTDNDGVADKREVWFDGGVLGPCANDVHGPYPGPDGRYYWTKGGFEKQEVVLRGGKKFTTKAAHIYRAKPDGSEVEVVMTGGMDNPVDVAFSSAGEMFFTTTFFQHPANGKRDGIVHATYGAVYGKDHDPVQEHIRTRPELSEPMTHLGPAAPAGLHCYRSGAFGKDYTGNLFACQFNMAKVSRHVLKPLGSTYRTEDSDFVASDNRDFHPTDVVEDGDGSLLVIDTGGWYKLCCPSSVMEKKDVLGAIYRIKREGKHQTDLGNPTEFAAPPPRIVEMNASGTLAMLKKIHEERVRKGLNSPSLSDRRRTAVEIGSGKWREFLPDLLATLANEKNDRVLDTAFTRALVDVGDADATRKGLGDKSPKVVRATLAALEHIPDAKLTAKEVLPHLVSPDDDLRETAWWIAGRHKEWGDELIPVLKAWMKDGAVHKERLEELAIRLGAFASRPKVQELIAEAVRGELSEDGVLPGGGWARGVGLRAMALANLKTTPDDWWLALADCLNAKPSELEQAVTVARKLPPSATPPAKYARALFRLAANEKLSPLVRVGALAAARELDNPELIFVGDCLANDDSAIRGTAVEAVTRATLNPEQLVALANALPKYAPMERANLLPAFAKSADEAVGLAVVKALSEPNVRAAIRTEQVKPILDKYPAAVQAEAYKLYKQLDADRAELTKKLDTILSGTEPGEVRRGQAVFNSAKAACTACHKVAYVGGSIGPDLTKIGGIRSDRDLLEAIVFPSASFVRSYEPVKVETKGGKTFTGILKADRPDEVVITVSATEEVRVGRAEIEELKPGTVSVMPAGLDQQLSKQELADLVAFLKSLK